MKSLAASLVLFFTVLCIQAQTVHVILIDGTTEKPIDAVKIKSAHDHDLITFSNDTGYFAFNLKHDDTILLQKDYYYPVYMRLAVHHFDSTHVIKIQLFPSQTIYKVPNTFSTKNLQAFEYHFTHDEIGNDGKAEITLFQTDDALQAQKVWTGKPLRIVTIDVFPHPSKPKNHYIMNQPDINIH